MTPERRLGFSIHFTKEFKRLQKKYRHIEQDVEPLLAQLRNSDTPGDQISGVEAAVYKVRVANSDAKRGKSGGYRVIYYLKTDDLNVLLTLYSKTEKADISLPELQDLIAAAQEEFSDDI